MLRRALPFLVLSLSVLSLSVLSLAVPSHSLAAQQPPAATSAPSPKKPPAAKLDRTTEKERAHWRERARYWTDAALEEEWRLEPRERPILHARLGGLWWNADRTRARGYMEQAFDSIENVPKNETKDDAKMRLEAARAMVEDAGPPDASYRARAIRVVTRILDTFSGDDDWQLRENAMQSFEDVLRDSAQTDMPAAAHMARTMIRYNSGNHFQSAWINVGMTDPAQASTLYEEALQQAARSHDQELIFGLGEIAYPQFERPRDFPVLPERLRTAYLDLLYASITRPAQSESERKAVCSLFLGGARLIQQLPPAQIGMVQPIAQSCKEAGNAYVASEIKASEKQLATPDDYLRAAADEPDLELRIRYKFRAAHAVGSGKDKDFTRALDILDGFTPEEKEKAPQWRGVWRHYGIEQLRAVLKASDHLALQRLIDRAPDEQKPFLFVFAATALRDKEEGLARSLYMEDRRTLERAAVDDPQAYTGLIGLCALLAPSEMPGVLKLAVDGLNQVPAGDPKKGPVHVLGYNFGPIGVPSGPAHEFADQDDGMLRAAIAELKSAHDRTAFRVAMTRSILGKYDDEVARLRARPAQPAKPAPATEGPSPTK